ncbi:hypothetical protein Tco_1014069 [Tanacetum coccineum]
MTSRCSKNIKDSIFLKHGFCEIDQAVGGKLHDKNIDEYWEIIENLALYDHEVWNDSKESIKPVKAISISLNVSKMPNRRLLELEDQINFLLKGGKPVPRASSTNIPLAYAEALSSNPHEPLRQNSFTFCECIRPNTQPGALGANFESRELTANRTLEKVLIREDTRHPTTKNVNSISCIRIEEEKRVENNGATDKSVAKPSKSDEQKPPKEVDKPNESGRRANEEPAKGARENFTKNKEEEPAGVSSSHAIGFHRIPEPHCRIEKGIKNNIEPIAPTMTVNRLVLEWEEKIKLHQKKEMKFDQRKSKIFSNERPTSVKEECKLTVEKGVT